MKRSKEEVKVVKEAKQGKERLDEIRFLLKTGQVDYDKARELASEPQQVSLQKPKAKKAIGDNKVIRNNNQLLG